MIINRLPVDVPSDIKLKSWLETGMRFKIGHGSRPRRHSMVDKIVVHWTGSERVGELGARKLFDSMARRKVGCHFAITNEGIIWQFNDPCIYSTSHAGRHVNMSSVGIEVSCIGLATKSTKRNVYEGNVGSWKTTFCDLYLEQYDALIWLCETLIGSNHLDIDRKVMSQPFCRRATPEIKSFSGILGHAHCTLKRKVDPGPLVMEVLKERIEAI